VVADAFSNDANTGVAKTGEIQDGWMGLDIGPETAKLFSKVSRRIKNHFMERPDGSF
jgi:phosphoglycerate kinase